MQLFGDQVRAIPPYGSREDWFLSTILRVSDLVIARRAYDNTLGFWHTQHIGSPYLLLSLFASMFASIGVFPARCGAGAT